MENLIREGLFCAGFGFGIVCGLLGLLCFYVK